MGPISEAQVSNMLTNLISVTTILLVLMMIVFLKIIYPIMSRKQQEQINQLANKIELLETQHSDFKDETKEALDNVNSEIKELRNESSDNFRTLNDQFDKLIVSLSESNINQMKKDSKKDVNLENHEIRISSVEREIKELKRQV